MGISTEMLMCEDMTLCTDLAHCDVVDQIATVLHSSNYYIVVTMALILVKISEIRQKILIKILQCGDDTAMITG